MRAWLLLLVLSCTRLLANTDQHSLVTNHSKLVANSLIGQAHGSGVPTKRFYQYDKTIIEAGTHYNIDPLFIKAILLIESGLNPLAVSKANARGIAQLMHTTAKKLGVTNCYDPNASIWGCAHLLRGLCNRFGNDKALIAAAYNAGPVAIIKAGKKIPSMRETQLYVPLVLGAWKRMYNYHQCQQECEP